MRLQAGFAKIGFGISRGDGPPLDQAMPRELLVQMIADNLSQKSDVKRLSLTGRFFFGLVRSSELVAAWLWKREGNEAMRIAMRHNDMAVFRQLVEVQRADVNAFFVDDDEDGQRGLLHWASENEEMLEFVTYLLSVPGIQVNMRDSNGYTPLQYACDGADWRSSAFVHELLQHPAVDVNSKTHNGKTALLLACDACHYRDDDDLQVAVVVELLGHPGIDINQACGPTSTTSLHVACKNGCARVVRELLKHPDVRVNQRTVESDGQGGWSALDYCLGVKNEHQRKGCVRELLTHPGLDSPLCELVVSIISFLDSRLLSL